MAFNSKTKIEKEEQELQELIKAHNASLNTVEEVQIEPETETETKVEVAEVESKETTPEDTTPEDDGFKKRYGDLRRHSQKKEEELKQKIADLEAQVKQKEAENFKTTLPATEAEMNEWQEENPQAFAMVETLARKIARQTREEDLKELEALKAQLFESKKDIDKTSSELEIKKAHPDFDALQESDEFHNWAESQPQFLQDIVYKSDNPSKVIWAIDTYKALKPKPSKKKDPAAEAVVTKTQPTVDENSAKGQIKESEVERMDEKTFSERYEEIKAAQASGKFIYDISGGAR